MNDPLINPKAVSAWSRLLGWTLANPLTASSLAGGLAYLLVSQSYRDSLEPFGVTPNEVGIDYTTAIWPVAQAILVLGLIFVVVFDPTSRAFTRAALSKKVVLFALLASMLLIVLTYLSEAQFVQSVRVGKPYEPWFSGRLAILGGLRATPVAVAWKDGVTANRPLPSGDLLLLGMSSSTVVIFSASTATTWRIPLGDVVLTSKAVFKPFRVGGPKPTLPP